RSPPFQHGWIAVLKSSPVGRASCSHCGLLLFGNVTTFQQRCRSLGVDLNVRRPLLRNVGFVVNCFDRTLRSAYLAVDADGTVQSQKPSGFSEIGFVPRPVVSGDTWLVTFL